MIYQISTKIVLPNLLWVYMVTYQNRSVLSRPETVWRSCIVTHDVFDSASKIRESGIAPHIRHRVICFSPPLGCLLSLFRSTVTRRNLRTFFAGKIKQQRTCILIFDLHYPRTRSPF